MKGFISIKTEHGSLSGGLPTGPVQIINRNKVLTDLINLAHDLHGTGLVVPAFDNSRFNPDNVLEVRHEHCKYNKTRHY
ncbi:MULTISPECIES: hypothetical protein [unclassified Saccharicrinis]|uniref:hypothetical protein n=1 Tax=unclassified Saccharicrinis TaxID=2646859 RepID=UPI003D34A699